MITGDEFNSDGRNFVNGKDPSVQTNVYKHIGYCPQYDALFDELTCRETLEFYALIRGVPNHDRRNYCENVARCFDLMKHMNQKISELSGGNKRKLSTALALIGNSSVIFLGKRIVWSK